MSDGGAQAIVEGVKLLWQVPGGKIILALIAGHLALSYVVSHVDGSVLGFVAVLLAAVAAMVLSVVWQRRRRQARAKLKQSIVLAGIGLVAVVFAGLALARRAKKGEALPSPPTAADVDAAAQEAA